MSEQQQPSIAPIVKIKLGGREWRLCWSFKHIRQAEDAVPGAYLISALYGGKWSMSDVLAAFVGSARKFQPELTMAEAEEMFTSETELIAVGNAVLDAWEKSRANPPVPPVVSPDPADKQSQTTSSGNSSGADTES